MRKIKFRVFFYDGEYKSSGEYVDAELAYSEGYIEFLGNSLIPIDECLIIEQFTGLHDKNGMEIYEGDIVKWLGHEVRNGKQVYPVRTHLIGGENNKWMNDLYILRNIITMQEVEIIGNIHENPELLQ